MTTIFSRSALKPTVLTLCAFGLVLATTSLNQAQTPPTPPTPPTTGDTRQPIVENQFTTTSSGALQARAPGTYTQQAIAIQEGTLDPFDGNVPDNTPWVRETFDMLFLQFVDIIQGLVDALNVFAGGNPLGNILPGGIGGGGNPLGNVLSNPLTSGGGSSVPVQ